MLDIKINEKMVNTMLEEAIQERVTELAKQKYFLTYTELAKYLSISKPVIEETLIKNGLKYYKVGSKYLFKREEVDEFLDYMTGSMTMKNNDLKLLWKINNRERII